MYKNFTLVFLSLFTLFVNAQQNWIQPTYSLYFSKIQMVSPNIGYAGGADGKVFKTLDAGVSWQYLKLNNKNDIKGLYFVNETNGWVCSGRDIYYTSNGGQNWEKKYSRTGQIFFNNIYALGNTIWVSCINNIILKSQDNGSSWELNFDGNTADPFQKILFQSPLIGYAIGNTSIKKTLDGGLTWVTKYITNTNSLYSFHFLTEDIGFITGSGGLLLKTIDGGATWIQINTGFSDEFYDISSDPNNNLYICGSSGKLIKSTNQGDSWISTSTNTYNFLFSISCPSPNQLFAAGADALILKSNDGGINFINSTSQISLTPNIIFTRIFMLSILQGWAVGTNGVIYKTENGGNSWVKQESNSTSTITGIQFINELIGWVSTSDGKIIKTDNGGTNWVEISSNTGVNYKNVHFVNETIGWAITSTGVILKTINAGLTWSNPTTNNLGVVIKLKINSITNLIAVSSIGKVYNSIDGGSNWTETGISNNSYILNDVFISPLNESNLWATSSTGIILKTNNGGNTWDLQSNNTNTLDDLFGITFHDNLVGWAVGANGTILKTINGGSSWTKDDSLTSKNLETIYSKDGNILAAGRSATIIRNNSLLALNKSKIEISGLNIKDEAIKISWAVEKTSPISKFELDRSIDGIRFENIATLSNNQTEYYDKNVFTSANTYICYRLKVILVSNSFEYSSVLKVSRQNISSYKVVHLENPSSTSFRLKITSPNNIDARISIYLLNGKLVSTYKQKINKGVSVIDVPNSSHLNKGEYYITTTINSQIFTLLMQKK